MTRTANIRRALLALLPLLPAACGDRSGATDEGDPLDYGDAEWPKAPFPPPGDNGQGGGDGDGEGDTGASSGTGGEDGGDGDGDGDGDFAPKLDLGGGGHDCLPMAMCDMAPGVCEAVGDGDGDTTGDGTGDTTGDGDGDGDGDGVACCDDPDCDCGVDTCGDPGCTLDGYCDCNCPDDPDCEPGACNAPEPEPFADESCPDSKDPVVLYMSNDDSNSQASPALVRRIVGEGGIVGASRVRIHEFLNYYDLSYDNPEDQAAKVGIQMRRTDADTGEYTLLLYAQGRAVAPEDRPRFNVVFSLDTSGSMSGEPLELLKDSVVALAGGLRAGDVVSLVEWSDTPTVLLDGHVVEGPNDAVLVNTIEGLETGGSTDLHSGLVRAYQAANEHHIDDGINRVVLVSDGGANAGVTEIELIAAQADDSDGEGVYLVGVGVGSASGYNDELMDTVTDAGKGAYVFVDEPAEAERQFGERFLSNVAVAARDVRMQLTMPWYFGIKEFHGEEYSPDPEEVEPQHLAPNDAMSFHQIVQACDPQAVLTGHSITARATWRDPITDAEGDDEVTIAIGDIVKADASQLHKGDVVVNYAKAFVVISDMVDQNQGAAAIGLAQAMVEWLDQAAQALNDDEIADMAQVMAQYAASLEAQFG
jgi:Ca-activated chloride channel family protein